MCCEHVLKLDLFHEDSYTKGIIIKQLFENSPKIDNSLKQQNKNPDIKTAPHSDILQNNILYMPAYLITLLLSLALVAHEIFLHFSLIAFTCSVPIL